VCCEYCRDQCECTEGTVVKSGCELFVLQGTVSGFCGYCREQCLCAVATVGNSGCVLWVL